jgi:hypothetical protein
VPGIEDIYRDSGIKNVSIPNLVNFAPEAVPVLDVYLAESFAAHLLGDIGSSYHYSMLPEESLDGKPWASNPAAFWNGTDHWEYVFLDSAPSNASNGPSSLSIYTNRTVRSTGACKTPSYQLNTNTTSGIATIQLLDGSGEVVDFPAEAVENLAVTYLTKPVLGLQATNSSCGPGCGNVKVVEMRISDPVPGSFIAGSGSLVFYYDCNITVTPIDESMLLALSQLNAAVAAQAIALSGQIPGLQDSNWVSYNQGLPFGQAQNNSATGMASQISRFAIGVIAAAAQNNPPKIVLGHQPMQGVRIHLDAPVTFDVILGLTGGLQLIMVIVTAALCHRLVIPEEILLSREEEIRNRFVLKTT